MNSDSKKKPKNPFWALVGQRIYTLLVINNKAQKELADYLGVIPNTISYWAKGERRPDIEQIPKIAKFFNVSSDYLLGLTDIQSPNTDIQAICNYTGLSEKAIKRICRYNEVDKIVDNGDMMFSLNRLLEYDMLPYILLQMKYLCEDSKSALQAKKEEEYIVRPLDVPYTTEFSEFDKECKIRRYELNKYFEELVDKVFDYRMINKAEYESAYQDELEKELSEYKKNPRPNDDHSDGE